MANKELRSTKAWALRWLLPVLIPVGGYLTAQHFEGSEIVTYFSLTVLSACACMVYVWPLKGDIRATIPYWGIFVILYLGHYVQFYWLLLDEGWEPWFVFIGHSMSAATLLEAYSQGAAAFAVGAVTTVLILKGPLRPRVVASSTVVTDYAVVPVSSFTLLSGSALLLLTAFLMYRFDIGVVGRGASLPYHLGGIIQHTRRTVVPACILLAVAVTDGRHRGSGLFWLALGVLTLDAIEDTLVSTTRAPLVVTGLRLFTLFVMQRSLNVRRIQLIVALAVGAIVLFPFVNYLRDYRSSGSGVSEAFDFAGSRTRRDADSVDSRSSMSKFALLSRFSGVVALLPIVSLDATVTTDVVIDGFTGAGPGVTGYNTYQVAGYSEGDKMGVAPSLLGWLYLVGGRTGQLLGVALVIGLTGWLWCLIDRTRIRVRPVAQAMIGTTCFQFLSDGNIEGMILPIVVTYASIVMLEIVVRIMERRTARSVVAPGLV